MSTQDTIHAQAVSDAVLKVAPASPAGAVEVMPNNAAQADVTIHHHRFVAVAAQLVSKVKPVSVEVAAAAVRPSAALLDAITRTPRFVAEVSVGTAPRDMTACQVEGVVHPARSAVVIASVITHERPLAVPDLELFGPVQSPVSVVQLDLVPTPRLKSAARMDRA